MKVALVIDRPSNCGECQLRDSDDYYITYACINDTTTINKETEESIKEMYKHCPLIELKKIKEVLGMKLYSRLVTKREAINRFGKLGYVLKLELVRTEHIEKYNHRKRIMFGEETNEDVINIYGEQCLEADKVYEFVWQGGKYNG